MRVPLTVCDFLERAELVYGDRVGIVDEPDEAEPHAERGAGFGQPAASWGSITYRELAGRARAFAAGMDALGPRTISRRSTIRAARRHGPRA